MALEGQQIDKKVGEMTADQLVVLISKAMQDQLEHFPSRSEFLELQKTVEELRLKSGKDIAELIKENNLLKKEMLLVKSNHDKHGLQIDNLFIANKANNLIYKGLQTKKEVEINLSLKEFCIRALAAREDLHIRSAYQVGAEHLKSRLLMAVFKNLND